MGDGQTEQIKGHVGADTSISPFFVAHTKKQEDGMRKFVMILTVALVMVFCVSAIAEEYIPPPQDGSGVIGNAQRQMRWRLGMFNNVDGVQFNIPLSEWRVMQYSAEDDYQAQTSQTYAALSSSTEPNLGDFTSVNGHVLQGERVQWSDGDGNWLETWFRVPDSYIKGGAFKFLVTQTDVGNDNAYNYIQFKSTIIRQGQDLRNATERTHTLLQVPANANEFSPQVVTLQVVSPDATSPNNAIAGSWIRLRYRRFDADVAPSGGNVGKSTGDLNVLRTYWDPSYSPGS